jgi:Skp family chaperone for outer membrane proteins
MSKKGSKNFFLFWGVFLTLCVLGGGAYLFLFRHSSNVSQVSIKVGLLNGEKIGSQLPAIEHLKETLNRSLEIHKKKFARQELELRKENQELVQLQHALTPGNKNQRNSLEQRQKEFSLKVMKLQKDAEDTQKSLNDLYEQSMRVIKEKISQSIEKISEQKRLSLVLYSHQAAYYDDSLDITEDVFTDLKEFQYSMLKG